MKCVKVPLKQAQNVKIKLLELNALSENYFIEKDKNFVYFPVEKNVKGFDIVERKIKKKKINLNLRELLKEFLNKNELEYVSKSYDLIGNIAVVEIEEELLKKKKIIAAAFLKSNKNIKTIVRKVGGHEGEYRVQNYEYLAGVKNFETIHKENDLLLKFDIRKTYYSPRSSNERLRISHLIKEGEGVLVMFSGIGVYPIVLAKKTKAKEIYGVEINPDSCKYAEENLKINKTKNVKLFCGDVKKVLPRINKRFDRIIMPLPQNSLDFLDLALKYLNKNGAIHLYCFSSSEDISEVVSEIIKKCKCIVLGVIKAGQKSPRIYRYCIDFKVLN